jgi:acyl-CoA thioester hydrolase
VRPARLDDLVDVTTGPWVLRGASVEVQQVFRVRGQEVARLLIGLACIRVGDGRPARIPARWRAALGQEGI